MEQPRQNNFLESTQYTKFTADKKQIFLDMFVKNPNVTECAAACGIVRQTVFYAAERDPEFRAAFDRAKDAITDNLEAKVAEFGQRPQNFMDRIAWLRARRPEVWNPQMNVAVTVDEKQSSRLLGAARQYVEAELVNQPAPDQVNTVNQVTPPQVNKP